MKIHRNKFLSVELNKTLISISFSDWVGNRLSRVKMRRQLLQTLPITDTMPWICMRTSQKKLWSSSLGFLNELPGMNACITNGHYTKTGGHSDIFLVWNNIYGQNELIFENSYLSTVWKMWSLIYRVLDLFIFLCNYFIRGKILQHTIEDQWKKTIPTKFYN